MVWWFDLTLDDSGLVQHQASYHKILRSANLHGFKPQDALLISRQQQIQSGEMRYPAHAQWQALCSVGLSQTTYNKIIRNPSIFKDFTDAIHRSFQTESLAKMNLLWLTDFTAKVGPMSARNAVIDPDNTGRESIAEDGTVEVENFFLWCRDVMTLSTTRALYGDHDPFIRDKSLIQASW
jgi:hypothetical protein